MASSEPEPGIHDDAVRFAAAIRYTAAATGFSEPLIEKDYFCTQVLAAIGELFNGGLVFKGGTSLSKIHNDFYRLSEDLDFMVSVPHNALPGVRRTAISLPKRHLANLPATLPCIIVPETWNNESGGRHYSIYLEYQSCLTDTPGKIKFEISLRGEILTSADPYDAKTLLLDPTTRDAAIAPVAVKALSRQETYAEKICAAMTRRTPAIRDYYDLHHAVENGLIDLADNGLLTLARRKLILPSSDPFNEDPNRLEMLRNQLTTELRPVLRNDDFNRFGLESICERLGTVAEAIRPPNNESR